MDTLKPIRDLWEGEHKDNGIIAWARLSIAMQGLGQAIVKAARRDWQWLRSRVRW